MYFLCFKNKKILFIFRCYAALGDVAKARFLRETNRLASEAAKKTVIILIN